MLMLLQYGHLVLILLDHGHWLLLLLLPGIQGKSWGFELRAKRACLEILYYSNNTFSGHATADTIVG
jgi:hypothetical protein